MAKKYDVLQDPTLKNAMKKLEEYGKRRDARIAENNQSIADLKKKKEDASASMLKAASVGASSEYVAAKKEYDAAVEQLDFMQSFVASDKNITRCSMEEADSFYAEIRAGFHAICEDLDQELIKKLEAMRERLAEVEQLGMLLSDACEKFCRELDPKESRANLIFMGAYDFRTTSIGSLLSEHIFDDPEYVEISGVEMKGTTFFGENVFSDEKVREAEAISRELFHLR